jgi:hypothetical protein
MRVDHDDFKQVVDVFHPKDRAQLNHRGKPRRKDCTDGARHIYVFGVLAPVAGSDAEIDPATGIEKLT